MVVFFMAPNKWTLGLHNYTTDQDEGMHGGI